MQGEGGRQNASSGIEFAYYAAALVVTSVFIWWRFSAYIVYGVGWVSRYQAYAMLFSLDWMAAELSNFFVDFQWPFFFNGDDLSEAISFFSIHGSLESAKYATVEDLVLYTGYVGRYLMIFTMPLWLILSAHMMLSSIAHRYRTKYTMESFRDKEVVNHPAISVVLGKDYTKIDLDQGDFAMSEQPMQFAKKHGLLDEKQDEGKTIAVVNKERAYTTLSCQMGPMWNGTLENLQPHVLALFAIFASKAEHDTATSDKLLRQIARSAYEGSKKLDYSGVQEALYKHIRSMKVARAVSPHAYLYPAMASLLELAREDGVLATAEFLWLKPVDRALWYMLNSVGRRVAFPEVAGPFGHWIIEKRLKRPLKTPMLAEAITAMEEAIAEIIYVPDGTQQGAEDE